MGRQRRLIWGSSADNVFAVGSTYRAPTTTVVVRWDGTSWSLDGQLGSASGWTGLWGSGPDDVWAVAADGVHRRRSTGWEPVTGLELGSDPAEGWSFGPDDAWIAHGPDLISHWDGAAWTTSQVPYATSWYMHVAGDRTGNLWLASNNNILRRAP